MWWLNELALHLLVPAWDAEWKASTAVGSFPCYTTALALMWLDSGLTTCFWSQHCGPGARESIWVSHIDVRDLNTRGQLLLPSQCISRKLDRTWSWDMISGAIIWNVGVSFQATVHCARPSTQHVGGLNPWGGGTNLSMSWFPPL